MSEKIMTQHPEGKQGVNIDKAKYDTVRTALLNALDQHGDMTFTELTDAIDRQIGTNFDGSVNWYTVVVKQDLEARGIIQQTSSKPQRLSRI